MDRLTRCVGYQNGNPIYKTNIDMRCMGAVDKLKNALGKYEDAEEQGLLLRLPCKVGDTVYRCSHHGAYIDTCNITGFSECDSINSICYTVYIDPDEEDVISLSEFNETVFLTMEEAEKKQKDFQRNWVI